MLILDTLAYIYLSLFSLYHIIQGTVSVFFPDFAIKFNEFLYGFKPKEKEQLKMTFRPWGSFAFAIGVSGFLVLSNMEKYFLFLIPFAVLLIFRAGYRFILKKELMEYWKVTKIQNWRMIIIQLLGVILFTIFTISRL